MPPARRWCFNMILRCFDHQIWVKWVNQGEPAAAGVKSGWNLSAGVAGCIIIVIRIPKLVIYKGCPFWIFSIFTSHTQIIWLQPCTGNEDQNKYNKLKIRRSRKQSWLFSALFGCCIQPCNLWLPKFWGFFVPPKMCPYSLPGWFLLELAASNVWISLG